MPSGSAPDHSPPPECFDPAAQLHETPSIEPPPDSAPVVAIVGAGVAGLAAARVLTESGVTVRIADKGRSVGGRLATRRIANATLDHGAQFFTIRTETFARAVRGAETAGVAFEWCRGFRADGDGYPRYAAHGGMNRLGKHLAEGLDVALNLRIDAASSHAGRWRLTSDTVTLDADAVILTAPMPQNLAILDAGGCALETDLRGRLDEVAYQPTLALLATLDGPPALAPPGGVQLDDGPFSFIADNHQKGISDAPAVTFHVSHALSADRWDDDADEVLADLVGLARPWLGAATILRAQLKTWRYAQPLTPAAHEIESTVVDGAPLVFAGDAFAGAKVEGAFVSGHAAGTHLASILAPP